MAVDKLIIDKLLRPITLWVHPEGRVTGSIFVTPEQADQAAERPVDVLNNDSPFLVLQKHDPEEIRFYNRSAIVRAEYQRDKGDQTATTHTFNCCLTMMDGSELTGIVQECLPSDFPRLYDYLNQGQERFIKLHSDDGMTYLVNKSYVTQVVSKDS